MKEEAANDCDSSDGNGGQRVFYLTATEGKTEPPRPDLAVTGEKNSQSVT